MPGIEREVRNLECFGRVLGPPDRTKKLHAGTGLVVAAPLAAALALFLLDLQFGIEHIPRAKRGFGATKLREILPCALAYRLLYFGAVTCSHR